MSLPPRVTSYRAGHVLGAVHVHGGDCRHACAVRSWFKHAYSCLTSPSQVTPYRAGHVLGAAMFMVEIAGMRALYTGDYSRVPDRHLPGADSPAVQPDLGAFLIFLFLSLHFLFSFPSVGWAVLQLYSLTWVRFYSFTYVMWAMVLFKQCSHFFASVCLNITCTYIFCLFSLRRIISPAVICKPTYGVSDHLPREQRGTITHWFPLTHIHLTCSHL